MKDLNVEDFLDRTSSEIGTALLAFGIDYERATTSRSYRFFHFIRLTKFKLWLCDYYESLLEDIFHDDLKERSEKEIRGETE